jgi:branched-chain amino acid transport system substrate-binding protein
MPVLSRVRPALLIAALLVAGTGCAPGASTTTGAAPDPCGLKIAIFGPLSGDSANLGQNIHDGADLAVRGYNATRPDCPVRLADFDSQADPKRAPAIAQLVVADPQIVAVIGPAFSGESEAANPLLQQAGLAAISPSATEASLTTHGWTTFHRIIGSDAKQGPAAATYISTVLRAAKVFVIDDSQAYGHGLAVKVIDGLGPAVVQSATVLPHQRDFPDLVTQIRRAEPDAVFFGGYYEQAGSLLAQIRQAGVAATFVAGDGVKDDGFLRQAGPQAAEGAVITCPCRPPETAGGGFAANYRATLGRDPGTYSAEAYDAATVILRGIEAGRIRRSEMAAFINDFSGPGITAPIRFTATGELVDSSVTVWAYRVHDGAIVADRPISTS